jgi:hypothetical protein
MSEKKYVKSRFSRVMSSLRTVQCICPLPIEHGIPVLMAVVEGNSGVLVQSAFVP